MELLRREKPLLSLPEDITREEFPAWQKRVREKLRELLQMPTPTEEPPPVLLSSVQRDGYRVEKWEFYPDPVSAVPVLMLIPDGASAESPVPAVFCFPGSEHPKEFIAGEPLIDHPKGHCDRFPGRNRMARYIAKNGMVAVAFDPLAIGELAPDTCRKNEHGGFSRHYVTYGYLEYGGGYIGMSVFQKLRFLEILKKLPYVDATRIGVSGHSLGTETAITMALVSDDIKAVVFNDLLSDPRLWYTSVTEMDENDLFLSTFWSHVLPGKFRYFGYQDLCAALAPRYLALNEGGAYEHEATVRRAYALMDASDHFSFTHYPEHKDPATRKYDVPIPRAGLSNAAYFNYTYTVPSEHSYREAPAIALLKEAFGLD